MTRLANVCEEMDGLGEVKEVSGCWIMDSKSSLSRKVFGVCAFFCLGVFFSFLREGKGGEQRKSKGIYVCIVTND